MSDPFKQRMKLADYPDAIAFYDQLERQRALTDAERDRLHQLVRRYNQCLAGARYRANHPEKAEASRAAWRSKPKNQKKASTRRAEYYKNNRSKEQRQAAEWRAANPEKVEINRVKSEAVRKAKRPKWATPSA